MIVFDEIQEAPKALASLKYFYENAPQYSIIAAGSLIGVALHQGTSFPVGKVDFVKLCPMSFNEFILAVGEKGLHEALKSQDYELINAYAGKYTDDACKLPDTGWLLCEGRRKLGRHGQPERAIREQPKEMTGKSLLVSEK